MRHDSPRPYTRPCPSTPTNVAPWTPENAVTIRDAFDLLGKTMFPDEWTGREFEARLQRFTEPAPPVRPLQREPQRDTQTRRPAREPDPDPKVSYVVDGNPAFLRYSRAVELFVSEKGELIRLWREETAAADRYRAVEAELRRQLHAEMVKAFILTRGGSSIDIPIRIWAANNAHATIRSGITSFSCGNPYFPTTVEGQVFLARPDIEQSCTIKLAGHPSDMPENEREHAADAEPNRGGRPRKYDWEAFLIEASRRIYLDGLPDPQAKLEREMQDWFIESIGDTPADSEIRKRVSRLCGAIRSAENSPE